MKKRLRMYVLISVVAVMILSLGITAFASNKFGEICAGCGSDNLKLKTDIEEHYCGEVYCKDCRYYCFDPQHDWNCEKGRCNYCGYRCQHVMKNDICEICQYTTAENAAVNTAPLQAESTATEQQTSTEDEPQADLSAEFDYLFVIIVVASVLTVGIVGGLIFRHLRKENKK